MHSEDEQKLLREKSDMQDAGLGRRPYWTRGRQLRTFKWPAVLFSAFLAFLVLGAIFPRHHPLDSDISVDGNATTDENAVNQTADARTGWRNFLPSASLKSQHKIAAESLISVPIGSPAPVEDAILHPGRNTLTSPNGEWRVTLTEDADLVLEQRKQRSWHPIWWADGKVYKQKYIKKRTAWLTLTADGSLDIVTQSVNSEDFGPHKVEHRWSSSLQRQCHTKMDTSDITHSLTEKPVANSLMLDDRGRLVIWKSSTKAHCILSNYGPAVVPSLHKTVNTTYDEAPLDIAKGLIPMYRNSSLMSHLQMRALLEQDLARMNKTLDLSTTQLDTIYNNAMIIPSYDGHMEYCIKFLKSMVRNCVDCHLFSINIVVLSVDIPTFQQRMLEGEDSLLYWLPNLKLIEYETMHFEHYSDKVDVAAATKKQWKNILQDFKKNHGCLVTGKRYCILLDSEGIIAKTTWYADLAKEYLDAPYVIHDPNARNGSTRYIGWSTPVGELLGIDNFESAGWLLEYYAWMFDSRIYSDIARIIAEAWPEVDGCPKEYFGEIVYFAYIWANKGSTYGTHYRFITARELLGDRLYDYTWTRWMKEHPRYQDDAGDITIIEDLRAWMSRFPDMLVPAAQAWNAYGLRYFKAGGDWWQSIAFLSIAKSVNVFVSDQPRDLYEAAMAGAFNQ